MQTALLEVATAHFASAGPARSRCPLFFSSTKVARLLLCRPLCWRWLLCPPCACCHFSLSTCAPPNSACARPEPALSPAADPGLQGGRRRLAALPAALADFRHGSSSCRSGPPQAARVDLFQFSRPPTPDLTRVLIQPRGVSLFAAKLASPCLHWTADAAHCF